MMDDFNDSKVTVKKVELLDAIKSNCALHRAAFLEAQTGYRAVVIEMLDRKLNEARNGKPFVIADLAVMAAPQDHTKDYERVIRMLEMSTADTVLISEGQFAQYVLDDWGWKAAFIATNSRYSR